jgi:hypothetical protein
VRQDDRQRHQLLGLVRGVAEHHPLVAGALVVGALAVDALCDVGRLPVDRREDGAGPVVKAELRVGVADALDRGAHDVGDVDVGRGGDLAGHHGHAGGDQRFTGHPRRGIAGENGVEHGVGNLVGDLVGVPFRDRFGREDVACGR